MNKPALKKFPSFKTDEEAEEFVANADLTEYDFSDFKPFDFDSLLANTTIDLDMSVELFDAIKAKAKEEDIPYKDFMRLTLEKAVAQPDQIDNEV